MKKVITHNGEFHADDVFAVATLRLVFGADQLEVTRTRDPEIISAGDIVVDVGGEYNPVRFRFDHHQKDGAGVRENGVPYAAFGLVWKHFNKEITSLQEVAQELDESLVQTIDAHDNGINIVATKTNTQIYTIADAVEVFANDWKEEAAGNRHDNETFLKMVDVAEKLLRREILVRSDKQSARGLVLAAYKESNRKDLIVLAEHYPWKKVLVQFPEPLYVVAPYRDKWAVSAVPVEWSSFTNRKDLPPEWAGKEGDELAGVSGVLDAVFCHRSLFFAVAKSKEGALALAEKAISR